MKINFFNYGSPLFPLRWFIVFAIIIITAISYADLTGWKLFSFDDQQEWRAGAQRGYHK